MSADEHLNPQQFYHATDARLKRGDLIVPRADPRHPAYEPRHEDDPGDDEDSGGLENTSRQTYMTNDADFADHYGKYTYRVEPTAGYGRDWRGYHEGKSYVSDAPLRVKGLHAQQPNWDRTLP